MTNFNTAILITADATAAKRELGSVIDVTGRAGTAVGELGKKSALAEGQIAALVAEIGGMRTRLEQAMAAEAKAAAEMGALTAKVNQLEEALGRGHGRGRGAPGASGAVGNLIAQFNDVGVMLAAGQSPLLLAAQQGTQISQALGQAGAGGVVRTLGAALLGMLNPTTLAVLGTVAGLGLLTQGLRGLVGEARSVEDAFGDLDAATKAWREAASVGVGDLAREFGAVTPEIVAMQRQMQDLRLTEMLLAAAAAAETLGEAMNPANFEFNTRGGKIADLLGVDERAGVNQIVTPQVEEMDQLLGTLRTSINADEQIAALDRMQDLIAQAAGGLGKMNEEQRDLYNRTVQLERQLRTVQAAEEGIGSAQRAASDSAYRMLGTLRDEAHLRQLTALYGDQSRQVAEARHDAERRTYEATLATLDVSDLMRRKLLEAWDAANGLQGSAESLVGAFFDAAGASGETQRAIRDAWDLLTGAADATNVWASAMSGVAAEVRGIGAALSSLGAVGIDNASKKIELEALQSGSSVAEANRAVREAKFRDEAEINEVRVGHLLATATLQQQLDGLDLDRKLEAERKLASERDRASRGIGGAGRSGSRQSDGAARLVASLNRELEILRASDPVQKEMIRNREALAGATDAERLKVEQLIAAKLRETEQQKQAKEAWEFGKSSAYDALDAIIFQGEKASDVMANLAKSIGQALLQSALLGTGPLAGIFGGQGAGLFDLIGGGIFGGGDLFSNIGGFAEGGLIAGPGGPRDDRVLSWLSNGEFVVNAAATARHRPLLEAINGAPRFAAGGLVGGGAAAAAGADGGRLPIVIDLRLTDDLDARIAEQSHNVSVRVMRGGLEEYNAKVLPRRFREVNMDPRRVG